MKIRDAVMVSIGFAAVGLALSVLAKPGGSDGSTSKNAVTVRLYKTRNKLKAYLQERGYTV